MPYLLVCLMLYCKLALVSFECTVNSNISHHIQRRIKGGHWAMAPKDFLAPKYRLKRRLIGSSRFRKITKFVATRCQIVRLKCIKFNFAPDPAWGAYGAPPNPVVGFKGPTSKGREGKGWGMRGEKGTRGEGKEGRRREGALIEMKLPPKPKNVKYASGFICPWYHSLLEFTV